MKENKIFYKYNNITGQKEYLKTKTKPTKPTTYCERCGDKKDTIMASQGFYHYLCRECYDACFFWNGPFLEFTDSYHHDWQKVFGGLK